MKGESGESEKKVKVLTQIKKDNNQNKHWKIYKGLRRQKQMHSRQNHNNDLEYQVPANSQSYQNFNNGNSSSNSYAQNQFNNGNYNPNNQIDGSHPKSFLSQNNSPKNPFQTTQQTSQKGTLGQSGQSTSASNLSTKRDYFSPTNKVLQGQSQSQLQVSSQYQQPQKNNFFNSKQQQNDQLNALSPSNIFQVNQQQNPLQQFENSSQSYGYLKKIKQQSLSLQPSQPSALQNHQHQSGIDNKGMVIEDFRHTSADQKRNKENLSSTLSKIYYNQPQSTKVVNQSPSSASISSIQNQLMPSSNSNSNQKNEMTSNLKSTKQSPREGFNQNNTKQHLRSSVSNQQLDQYAQRNSNNQQVLKSTASDSHIQNLTLKVQSYQDSIQVPSKGLMYHSGIVNSSPQMFSNDIHQNMKRSEIIESRNFGTQQQPEQQQQNSVGIREKENHGLFQNDPRSHKGNDRANRPKSHYKNDSEFSVENKKDQQRVQSAVPFYSKKGLLERKNSNKNEDIEQQQQEILQSKNQNRNVQDKKGTKTQNSQNEEGGQKSTEPKVYSDEYQEYKKLQQKLNYLEQKIMSIKSNIDSTYKKGKDEQTKEISTEPQRQRESSLQNKNSQSSSIIKQDSNLQQNPSLNQNNSNNKNSFVYLQSLKNSNLGQNSNKHSKDQEGTSNQAVKGNSFSVEQSSTKQLTKTPSSSSSSNILKNSSTEQQIQIPQADSKQNPLASFVTQVSKGSGIPLSPKTATNLLKRNQLEEKITSTVHYDPTNSANSFQPNIPKSYLNNKISSSAQKVNESKGGNNSSYSKKRENSDSFEGYQSASQKNSKSNLIVPNHKSPTNSGSLKNSNVFTASQSSNASTQKKSSPPFIYYVSPIIKAYEDSTNQSTFSVLAREHLIQTMMAINFSRMLKPVSQKIIDEKKVFLPTRRDNKKTLVFDLDETLIHCNENSNIPSDVMLPIQFPTGEVIKAGINIRPYCIEILEELSKLYEIVIFTASHSCYANVVLDHLDPNGQFISGRLFRENCVTTEDGVYIKDLRVIANRNMSDMVLVDNAAYSFGFQIDNGIPIIPFYDNKSDVELKHLTHFMKQIHNTRDLREIMKKFLKVGQYSEFNDPLQLIQTLFEDLL